MASMNPALDGARFCPRCGRQAKVVFPRSLTCDTCEHQALGSPEPVAATIPRADDGVPRETEEATEVRAFAPADIPWDQLAFWSTTRALRDMLAAG